MRRVQLQEKAQSVPPVFPPETRKPHQGAVGGATGASEPLRAEELTF